MLQRSCTQVLSAPSALPSNSPAAPAGCAVLQFFITTVDTPWLDGRHVVFGRVLEGFDLVDRLQHVEVGRSNRPLRPVVIADCGLLDS